MKTNMFNQKKILIFITILLCITNVVTFVSFNGKVNALNNKIGLETIYNVVETSANTLPTYEFARKQYANALITANYFSELIGDILEIHDSLKIELEQDVNSKNLEEIKKLSISLLEQRIEGFKNLKSAIDLSSDNYNNIARNNFDNADIFEKQLLEILSPK